MDLTNVILNNIAIKEVKKFCPKNYNKYKIKYLLTLPEILFT